MENYKLSDLIDLLKNNCSEDFGKMRKPILDDISDLKNSLESSLINLLFLGYSNEGKTTMIISVIACVTNKYDNVRLLNSKSENTYFPIVIESSLDKDNNYQITIIKSNEILEEWKTSDSKQIN